MSRLLTCNLCKQTGFKSTGGLKNHQSRSKKCAMARQILSNSATFAATVAPPNLQLPRAIAFAADSMQVDEETQRGVEVVAELEETSENGSTGFAPNDDDDSVDDELEWMHAGFGNPETLGDKYVFAPTVQQDAR